MKLPAQLTLLLCSSALAGVVQASAFEVQAVQETRAVLADIEGHKGDPDDPAIWVYPGDATKSIVIVTLKKGGMDVYDMEGTRIQHITPQPVSGIAGNEARFNNVDIASAVRIKGHKRDLAIVSDRNNDMLRFFEISQQRLDRGESPLREITAPGQSTLFNDDPDAVAEGDFTAYGMATTQPDQSGNTYVYVSANASNSLTRVQLEVKGDRVGYRISDRYDLPDTFTLPDGSSWSAGQSHDGYGTHAEGMVVDDANGVIYISQEDIGVWKAPLQDTFSHMQLMDRVNEYGMPYTRSWNEEKEKYSVEYDYSADPGYGSDYLSADAEGLSIYDAGNGAGYLVLSSQGSSGYVVYDRRTNQHLGNFAITENTEAGVDGVEETDSFALSSSDFGGRFSSGVMVVQDGQNLPELTDADGETITNANFKFVPWSDIADAMGLSAE